MLARRAPDSASTPRFALCVGALGKIQDTKIPALFEPLDFIARSAALVPPARLNLTRFQGVFVPTRHHRARVTPACRGRGAKPTRTVPAQDKDRTPAEQRAAMRWAQRQIPRHLSSCAWIEIPVRGSLLDGPRWSTERFALTCGQQNALRRPDCPAGRRGARIDRFMTGFEPRR